MIKWDLFKHPNKDFFRCSDYWGDFNSYTFWGVFSAVHTTTGAVAYPNAYFGHGTGPILLDDLLCTGREARLIECPRFTSQGIGTYDFCPRGHGEDAGVGCSLREHTKHNTNILH